MRPAFAALPALLLTSSPPAAAAEIAVEHERYQLDNGLDVILAPDTSNPIVHTQLWVHVGSKDEAPGRSGFAHLFEHLMFQGSANAEGDYFIPLQEIGGRINGTTNTNRTNYFETVPSQYLPLALFMESDRFGTMLDVLDMPRLDNQREVVRNERRQRYENPPYGEVWVTLTAAMFPEGHPYHHTTIGSHEDLEAATLQDVSDFFATWYVPNNTSLVVVGDFEVDTAKALIEEQFGWIPRGPDPIRTTAEPVVLEQTQRIVQHDDVPDAKVWLAWHSPAFYAPGDAELDVAADLLCGSKDSRLHRELVKERKIARDVSCFQSSSKLGSGFIVQATAVKGGSTDAVVEVIDDQLAQLLADAPPTDVEVATAVTGFEVGFFRRIQTIQGRAGALSSYLFYLGDPDGFDTDLARYRSATPDSVVDAARAVLTAPRVELHVLPQEAE